jgi:hypothetical protein
MFKNKRKHKFDTTEQTQENQYVEPEIKDEYTLGKKSDEKQFVPLDSVYERDFDQKFLMNKHNFE